MSVGDSLSACAGCAGELREPGADAPAVARRTFLAQSAMLAAMAALAACGASGDSTSPGIATGTTVNISSFPALATVGGIAVATIGGAQLAIVRTGTTSFVALSRVCPHEGFIVNPQGSGFYCPGHGATFNQTGQWTGGQRTSNLHSYATSYDAATTTLTIS